MIRRLLRTAALAIRTAVRSSPRGGQLPSRRPGPDERPVILSPGRTITDPDEAEALGMTATARRLRRERERP